MKTNTLTPTPPATPNFAGIVTDPESGRLCALQIDICRGLGLAGNQVTVCRPRIYQGRFIDVLDVVEARKVINPKGRPRIHRGMILTELVSILAAMVAGTAVAGTILAVTAGETAGTLRKAVDHREHTVRTMEELGFSGAAIARAEWEATKPAALAGIASLETISTEEVAP